MFAALLLTLAAIAYRLLTGLLPVTSDWAPNFAPLAAIALCAACYLPRRLACLVPLGALLVSDLILNARYGAALLTWEMAARYAALAFTAWLGASIAARAATTGRSPALPLLGGSLLSSVIFHLATNTASWLTSPAYAKTAAGWVQSWTLGLPEVQPPAWVFFRNTAVSDLLFTALFIACMALTAKAAARKTRPAAAPAPSPR